MWHFFSLWSTLCVVAWAGAWAPSPPSPSTWSARAWWHSQRATRSFLWFLKDTILEGKQFWRIHYIYNEQNLNSYLVIPADLSIYYYNQRFDGQASYLLRIIGTNDQMYLSVRDAAAKLHAEGGFRAFYKGKYIPRFSELIKMSHEYID